MTNRKIVIRFVICAIESQVAQQQCDCFS